jgi:hypothetical protein
MKCGVISVSPTVTLSRRETCSATSSTTVGASDVLAFANAAAFANVQEIDRCNAAVDHALPSWAKSPIYPRSTLAGLTGPYRLAKPGARSELSSKFD